MSIVSLNTIKNWFKTGLKPTQAQFWDAWDSFYHKSTNIPAANIEGLTELIISKAEKESFDVHLIDTGAHSELFAKERMIPQGQLLVFKGAGNINNNLLEVNDYCIGFVQGVFINADYLGGDRALIASFNI